MPSGTTRNTPVARADHPQGLTISKRVWVAVVAVAASGIALILTGAFLTTAPYASSVLANLGTTVLLAAPLLLLERAFERLAKTATATKRSIGDLDERLQEVSETVSDFGRRLDEMRSRTNARVTEQRADDLAEALAPVVQVLEEPSFQTVRQALRHALAVHAIGGPIWLPLQAEKVILRVQGGLFDKGGEGIEVKVLPDDKEPAHTPRWETPPSYTWRAGESIEDFFVNLDQRLRRALGQSAPQLDAKRILGGLAQTLNFALRRAESAGDGAWLQAPPFAIPSEHWIVFGDALQHVGDLTWSFSHEEVLAAGSYNPIAQPEGEIPHADELPYAWLVAHRCYADIRLR